MKNCSGKRVQDVPPIAIAEKLVALSRADWRYADLYLRDAEAALASVFTRMQFQALRGGRGRIRYLASDLQRAIRLSDWAKAESLANDGSRLRSFVDQNGHVLSLAEQVYGARSLQANSTVFGLSGAASQPTPVLEKQISHICRDLRFLASARGSQWEFYQRRAEQLDRSTIDLPDEQNHRVDSSALQKLALAAVDRSDFAAVLQIARSAAQSGVDPLGRVRALRPASRAVERLAQPLPSDAIQSANALSLEPAQLNAIGPFNAYLSCCCADRVVLPAPSSVERQGRPAPCTCGHACPPEIGKRLKTTLDTFIGHPALTSAGTRYLPWFGAEAILVEVFPENEPDTKSPLLESLSLPRRLGIPRLAIENALLSRGPQVCEDLGLDPIDYRITCIPFDAYHRLAAQQGWGRQRLWTHFDGYHVTRDLKLLALVGGDIRHGGPDDLCAVGRSYDSDRITARFAVVRRDRFEVREPTIED